MTRSVRPHLRVLLGAATFADARSALQIVERMSNSVLAEIRGWLIQDLEILDRAVPSGLRIVTSAGLLLKLPTSEGLHQQYATDLRTFKHSLLQLARDKSVASYVEQLSGTPFEALFGARTNWDMVIIGHSRTAPFRARIVLVIVSEAADAERYRSAVQMLLPIPDQTLVVIPVGSSHAELEKVLHRINRMALDAVVVNVEEGLFDDAHQLARLQEVARCPIILFGKIADDMAP